MAMKCYILLWMLALFARPVDAQRWRKRKTSKMVDTEEPEVDPSVYGDFAAQAAAAAAPLKREKKARRDPRAAPEVPDMADLVKAMGGGAGSGTEYIENIMKMVGGDGSSNALADMIKGLGGMDVMDMGAMMQQGMGMWKEMLNSPEMQEVFSDPNQMRELMTPFVEMMGGDKTKLEEALADPEALKNSMNQGIDAMTDLVADPNNIKDLTDGIINAFDPETKEKLKKLVSGGESIITDMLAEVNPSGELQELMSDPTKLQDPAFLQKMKRELGLTGEGGMDMEQLLAQINDGDGTGNGNGREAGGMAS